MANKAGIVNIHGKDYMTVAKRVELWLADNKENRHGYSIETEIVNHDPVVVKAVIKWKGNTFNGVSSVALSSMKQIEKQNPYEVAETSAVGRALGFAGYGLIDSIASVDEMYKAGVTHVSQADQESQNSGDFSYVSDEESTQVVETYNDVAKKEDVPTVEASDPTDSYKTKSLASLRIAVSQLMNAGRIEKNFPLIAKLEKEDAIRILSSATKPHAPVTKDAEQEALALSETGCEICGEKTQEKRGVTKAGKPYHALFCASGERSHTKWLAS